MNPRQRAYSTLTVGPSVKNILASFGGLWLLGILFLAMGAKADAAASSPTELASQWDAFPIVDEIDTAQTPPIFESSAQVSVTTNLLGQPARWLPPGDKAKAMGWVIGQGRGLKAGQVYLLSVEFPDDLPRSIFVANRGADLVRGFSTGPATGDARRQYTQPSLESLNYPQSGRWQRARTFFYLNERFLGARSQRNPQKGSRTRTPDDGFHVLIFQTMQLNDPRSQGAAVGRIRLHAVPNLDTLFPTVEYPPSDLPRRRLFFREEMGDEPISAAAAADRSVADPVAWYVRKARLSRLLGFNTFTKDLLEFGFNQGWDSGDPNWVVNAQPPLTDLWAKLVPRINAEGLDILPYYEYKGGLGQDSAKPLSLGLQRRAEKLYHQPPNTNYTSVWWVEGHNADATDPETLKDAQRVLDRTITALKDKAHFAGAWFRTRDNHLPMSFAEPALARFRQAFPDDSSVQKTTRETLRTSYETDRQLYDRYVNWWLEQRRVFLSGLQQHLAKGLGNEDAQLLFTPWICEPVPMLRNPESGTNGAPIQITTDDPTWWDAFARTQPGDSWFRWALSPTPFDQVIARNAYAWSLAFREPISKLPWRIENYHSAPNADPEHYQRQGRVMMTLPVGRLFTVSLADLLESYRTEAGLSVIRHYPLNEDDAKDESGPFGGCVGYASVDVERAGPSLCLVEARAVANGDPRNIGYLSGSVYSCGFPEYAQRFNTAFLAVPALPSRVLPGAASDADVVLREIPTPKNGTYYYLVNPSLHNKTGVTCKIPGTGKLRDLTNHQDLPSHELRLDLYPGELRSYRVAND